MHPYDAKVNFFSEVDVLRGPQSKGPADVYQHVGLAFACAAACVGAAALVVLSPQNAHFCYCMRIAFAYVFFSIYSNSSFVCIFTNAFSCSHLPPTRLRLGGLTFELSK